MTDLKKTVKRITTIPRMPHGYRDRLVVSLHPGGVLEIREVHARKSVKLDIGTLYVKALLAEARQKIKDKK